VLDFFVMAPRRPKNPINDIVNSAGRWVGGAAQSLDRALTADQDPTVNPLARRGIGTTQSVLDFASGGAVAAMKGGPDDVQRFASTQLALMTGLPVAGAAVGAAAKGIKASGVVPLAVRKAADVAWEAKYNAKMLKPVTTRKLVAQRNQFAREKQQLQEMIAQSQSEAFEAGDLISRMGSRVPNKTVKMANEFITQYQDYNPVYERAENKAMNALGDLYRASNAPQGMRMEYTRKDIRKQLLPSAQDLYADALGRMPQDDPMRIEAFNQLQRDVRQAKAFQQAEGIMARKGIETTRNLPALSDEQRLAKEYRDMVLQDRVEAQVLRSMLKRSKNKNPKRR
jgi:hypothetical protein